jgi:hypothetical protein
MVFNQSEFGYSLYTQALSSNMASTLLILLPVAVSSPQQLYAFVVGKVNSLEVPIC